MGPACTGLGHCQEHSKWPKSCDHNVPGQFRLSTFWINWDNGLTMDLDGSFWMFLTMYQVMWPPHTILGHGKSIWPKKRQIVFHVPDCFFHNVPSTLSQCTKLGKLKTHGKFILKSWYILNEIKKYQIFTMYSKWTCHVFLISQAWYIVKTLKVHFEQTNQEHAGRIWVFQVGWT